MSATRYRTEMKTHHRSARHCQPHLFLKILSAAGAGTDSMAKSLGDRKASILTQLQHNKQTPAENYAEFAEER